MDACGLDLRFVKPLGRAIHKRSQKRRKSTFSLQRYSKLGNSSFWIGYSYEDGRFLDGDICECRVWNRILTQEEIQAKNHFYTVSPEAEGLVAYWKFDEGAGIVVKDHTNNGNNIASSKPLTWKAIELPAK